jgi:hypothetical protein
VAARVRVPLVVVLAGAPFVLAFFAGGYFDKPRLYAGLGACALVVATAVASRRPLPSGVPGRLALGGLAVLALWTAISIAWAPLSTPAVADADRLLLYVAAFTAALALLDARVAVRALEPLLAAGALVVVAYGLSERLLPGIAHIPHDSSALGRLSRPLTYWNAMGTMAALGMVLACRVAGDSTRPAWLRAAAACTAAPLGLGVYLSFSRGALAALAVGLVLLGLLARDRAQLRGLGLALGAGILAAVTGGAMAGVRALEGSLPGRERQGLAMLAVLVVLCALTGLAQLRLARRERAAPTPRRPLSTGMRRALTAAFVVLVVGGFVLAAAISERRPGSAPSGATSARLTSVQSHRSDYWRVALHTFADHPLRGIGSGGFAVAWLQKRTIREGAVDAHSLYIETPAELGLVGLLALAALIGGILWGATRAYARDPVAAIGLIAGVAVWMVHAGLDWLWEIPAITLPALILAAGLLRRAESPAPAAEAAPVTEERPVELAGT